MQAELDGLQPVGTFITLISLMLHKNRSDPATSEKRLAVECGFTTTMHPWCISIVGVRSLPSNAGRADSSLQWIGN